MKYRLDEKDSNMGNEDTWDIIVSDDKSDVYILHWFSHRDGKYDFKSGTDKLTLEDLKNSKQWLYEKAVKYLKSIGYPFQQ